MNTTFKYYLVLLSFVLLSCEKYQLDDPQLEVTADKTTVKTGEPITFNFKGNPQMLYFYSGEFLNDYNKIEQSREINNGYLSFSSATLATILQKDQLSILASSDFDGTYKIDKIRAANWVDITNRFTLAKNATVTPSGQVNVMDLVVDGKPLYIAFRYITQPQSTFGNATDWNITAVTLTSKWDDGEYTIMDYANGSSFFVFSQGVKQAGRSIAASTALQFKGNSTASIKDEYTEDWAVSRAITFGSSDIGTDKSISLKLFRDATKETYTYTYNKPGIYTATFIGETNNIYGNKKVLKQINVNVTN